MPSIDGSVETRTSRSVSAKLTDDTPVWVTTLWARVASPVRVSGSARLLRTSGLTAICSARPATRRPSTRSKVAPAWASDTPATRDQDDDDDRELEGEQLPRQRRATSPEPDHYELNLLCVTEARQ